MDHGITETINLDPNDFIMAIRHASNPHNAIYERQYSLSLYTMRKVILVGAGGVGSWFGILATQAGIIDELHIFDDDHIEAHNLNRLPYPQDTMGRLKVDVLKESIERLRDDVKIYAYPYTFNPDLVPSPYDYVIVCTVDNPDSYDQCVKFYEDTKDIYNTSFLRLACSANSVTATNKISSWVGDDRSMGYEGIQIWNYPTILAALGGVYSLATGHKVDNIFNPNDLYTKMTLQHED